MGPLVETVPSDRELPSRADVVVIGGGIIGIVTAMFLAERGLSVTVVEKGHVAGEQSSRNWGWCRQARRDPREFDLIRESLKLWRGMDARIGGDTGFTECGIFFGARDEATVESYTTWVGEAAQAGIATEMASSDTIRRLLPGDLDPPKTGLYCATDGRAEPQRAVPAMARYARSRSARILADCAARGIETAGGRIVSVVTERGSIATDRVVVAGGAWTRRILRDLDVDLPQLKVRSTVSRTQPIDGGPDCCFWDELIGLRKRADGGYSLANGLSNAFPVTPDAFRFFGDYIPLLKMDWRHVKIRLDARFFLEWAEANRVPLDQPSPYEACRVLDPTPDRAFVEAALKVLKRRFPAFADARLVQVWAGMIDCMPDTVPVISTVDGIAGLVVATGFSGHGFGIGPGAGHLVADMVTGAKPIVDPREFRLSRYRDGSNPRPRMSV